MAASTTPFGSPRRSPRRLRTIRQTLRLARAAKEAGDGKLADTAYAKAIANAPPRARLELSAQRAQARLANDDPAGAAALLWDLLRAPRNGAKLARAHWWETLGDAHRRAGTNDELISQLSAWLDQHRSEAAAWRTLARAQEAAGLDAIAAWNAAVALAPGDAQARTALIESLERKGQVTDAIEQLQRLLAHSPRDLQVGLDLASRLVAAGQREQGLQVARGIEARGRRRPNDLLLLLDFYNLHDEQDAALAVARRLVKVAPRKPQARIALGEQLFQMNQVRDALAQWGHLPRLVRPAHRGWARLSEVLSEHGRTGEAITALKKALAAAPKDPGYLRLRAVLAEDGRRPKQALKLWEEVRRVATKPGDRLIRDEARTRVVELLVGGSIPKRRTKLESAQAEAQARLDRGKPAAQAIEAGRFLAELHTRRENYAAAVHVQHRLLELQPDEPNRLFDLASAQRRAGQVESALRTLEELLSNDPSRSADVLAEMSELAFEAGDEAGALKAATHAARKAKAHDVDALIRLGQLHERRGNVDAAAKAYDRALQTNTGDARARLHLAELELTRG